MTVRDANAKFVLFSSKSHIESELKNTHRTASHFECMVTSRRK